MSEAQQLELDLETACQAAAISPETTNLMQLWQTFEPVLISLPLLEQLRIGGMLIDQLASLHQAKADWLLKDWEADQDGEDPAFSEDWLRSLVRQSQHVDVSSLTTSPQRRSRSSLSQVAETDSVVGAVDKTQVMVMVEQLSTETQPAAAIAIAHDENISDWVSTIATWLEQQSNPEVPLLTLQQGVRMPLVQLWLGLLLGGYALEQRGEFYEAGQIWVNNPVNTITA